MASRRQINRSHTAGPCLRRRAAGALGRTLHPRWTAALGPDHPHALAAAYVVAAAHRAAGEHRAARALDEDTLARRRRALGDDHPHTLDSANNLALDLRALGDHEAAREWEAFVERHRREP